MAITRNSTSSQNVYIGDLKKFVSNGPPTKRNFEVSIHNPIKLTDSLNSQKDTGLETISKKYVKSSTLK